MSLRFPHRPHHLVLHRLLQLVHPALRLVHLQTALAVRLVLRPIRRLVLVAVQIRLALILVRLLVPYRVAHYLLVRLLRLVPAQKARRHLVLQVLRLNHLQFRQARREVLKVRRIALLEVRLVQLQVARLAARRPALAPRCRQVPVQSQLAQLQARRHHRLVQALKVCPRLVLQALNLKQDLNKWVIFKLNSRIRRLTTSCVRLKEATLQWSNPLWQRQDSVCGNCEPVVIVAM